MEATKSGTSNDLYSFSLSPDGILAVGEDGIAMRYSVDTEKFLVKLPPAAQEVEVETQPPETVESHWEVIQSGTSQTYFTDTFFLSTLRGWIIGHNGVILYTTDGGKTWKPQHTAATENWHRIVFIDKRHGWIAGNGVLLRTENGGETWQINREGLENIYFVCDIHFINPKIGWIGVNDGQTLHTCDGGKTFRLQKTGLTNAPIIDLHFINNKEGWAVTSQLMKGGYILHTIDGGDYWQVQAKTHHVGVGVHFINETTGWVVMANGSSLTTTDSGKTWKQTPSKIPEGSRLHNVKFRNHTQAWSIADGKKLLTTRNQGETWETVKGSFGNAPATTGDQSWIQRMATDASRADFNLTNTHILENGHGWVIGATIAAPRTGDDYAIGAEDTRYVQDTIGQVYNTTDFGKNWDHQLGEQSQTFRDVLFLDEQHGWISGNNGILLSTEDGGETWQQLQSGTTQRIVDVHFLSLEPKWGGRCYATQRYFIRKTAPNGQQTTDINSRHSKISTL